jgi:hypothetical protein
MIAQESLVAMRFSSIGVLSRAGRSFPLDRNLKLSHMDATFFSIEDCAA